MTIQLLLVTGVTDCLWLYVLSLLLFLTVCFLLYQNFLLRKSASADDDYRRFLFDILDNLPFPIMVKDIQEQFKYTYWNKESELQSGISRKDAVGFSDVDIFGEESGKAAVKAEGVSSVTFMNGKAVLELQSGTYQFVVKKENK